MEVACFSFYHFLSFSLWLKKQFLFTLYSTIFASRRFLSFFAVKVPVHSVFRPLYCPIYSKPPRRQRLLIKRKRGQGLALSRDILSTSFRPHTAHTSLILFLSPKCSHDPDPDPGLSNRGTTVSFNCFYAILPNMKLLCFLLHVYLRTIIEGFLMASQRVLFVLHIYNFPFLMRFPTRLESPEYGIMGVV